MGQLSDNYLSVFCAELAELIKAGVGAGEGFLLLAEQEENAGIRERLESVYESAAAGADVCAAMGGSGLFPEYLLKMVRLGERTGALERVLRALSAYYDRQTWIKRNLRSAIMYPLVLFTVVSAVFCIFIIEVLPIFDRAFAQIGAEMMPAARLLLNLGTGLARAKWNILAVLTALLALALTIYLVPCLRNRAAAFSRRIFAGSRLGGKIAEARIAAAISLCLSGTSNLAEAMELACEFSDGYDGGEKIKNAADAVSGGQGLAQSFAGAGLFGNKYCGIISAGERAGTLELAARELSRRINGETEAAVESFIDSVEPFAIILLSVCVGALLLSVMLPLAGIMTAL